MIVPWSPVIITDIIGSVLTLVIAAWCAVLAWQWQQRNTEDTFRHYIFFLTLASVCFAISRSFGHLVKQFLILGGLRETWRLISPYSGGVNTTTFVVIFTISLYFERLHAIHEQLAFHKKNLEDTVRQRTEELATANLSLQKEIADRILMEEEKEKLSRQLRQTQKMEAIGTLAGGIAHDFNNILTPILGYAELTLLQLPPESGLRHNLEQMRLSANRAKELIRQILTFSRKTEQEYGPIELSPLVKEILKLIRATIPTTIEIQENIAPDSGVILADPTQIHQILINLCTNAYQAMEESGGVLNISLHPVGIEEGENELGLPDGQYVKLTVSDTGAGMDEATLERACEPFFTTKAIGKGSGMGLWIVHGIVAHHGGRMLIESRKGKGSTFMIYLPRLADETGLAMDRAHGMLPPESEYPGREHILLVDDEPAIVEMERLSLESLGYTITAFTDSELALRAFQEQPADFDLVLTDQSMPKLSGSELAAELLKVRKDIPIILCTGYSSVISAAQAAEVGIREYLMKPVTRNELGAAIRKVLDEGRVKPQPS